MPKLVQPNLLEKRATIYIGGPTHPSRRDSTYPYTCMAHGFQILLDISIPFDNNLYYTYLFVCCYYFILEVREHKMRRGNVHQKKSRGNKLVQL